ncbi:TetR/AcrR family transcriptional regulator [Aliikangiella coralliicola]|uniref:TetR/AcrR family transcriptional regulator n=1 Tax=Aliikangiella coralliicola TaxID=2592383 RepID=A0A545TSS8_9GAMM|nr:TetR/AcrR family transcriptional regulator [Aliikangiella coralliicola]TQV80270.1 TetR/AcrR family transcriptional regulator [Aliikangiella coralliicola]
MVRKKRDTSAKRESILDAAIDAFIEFGFEKTSMDLIAERANSSKRTVYNHFSSKESLIEEAFNRFLRGAFESKNIEYDPQKSIEDQLGAFADSKMKLTEDSKQLGLMRVTLCAFITHPLMAERAVLFSDSQEDGLVKWLKKATLDGRMNVKDPALAAESFWSLFAGTFFWPPIVRGPIEKKAGQKLKTEFIRLFLARYGNE